nr:putative zinc finger, CCHC-type [Tanacetum cinerariifolium]
MDLDHALRIDPPAALTVESTADQKHQLQYTKGEIENKRTDCYVVQEKERLKVEKPDVVHVATTNSNKRKGSWKGKGSSGDNSTPNKVRKTDTSTNSFQGGPKCKSCHKKGHTQKDCLKFNECTRIVETRQAKFLETANNSGRGSFRKIELQENRDETPIINVPIPINTPLDTSNDHLIAQDHPNNVEGNEPNPEINVEPQETQQPLRREAIEDKLNSMSTNNVWKLVELPNGAKPVGCKWVFKTKLDPNGNIARYKARLVAKGNFDMKDLGKASYVIGIEIHQYRANETLGLSQKAYIKRTLSRFNMQHCSSTVAPIIKGDVFGSHQCPKTKVEYEEIR